MPCEILRASQSTLELSSHPTEPTILLYPSLLISSHAEFSGGYKVLVSSASMNVRVESAFSM